jgi:hypothetical protein
VSPAAREPPGRWRLILTLLSVATFALALTQPAFVYGRSAIPSGPAWKLLLEGWRALPRGYLEWCANPALLFSWVAIPRRRPGSSLAAACIAAALMLLFLLRPDFAPYRGYWLWLGSGLLMILTGAPAARRLLHRS